MDDGKGPKQSFNVTIKAAALVDLKSLESFVKCVVVEKWGTGTDCILQLPMALPVVASVLRFTVGSCAHSQNDLRC